MMKFQPGPLKAMLFSRKDEPVLGKSVEEKTVLRSVPQEHLSSLVPVNWPC